MLERVVEDWLTKINERGFEIPFSQLLNAEGHKVLHLSRHGSYEEGKDIISVSKQGDPCAFQLKSGTITLKVWEEILPQIIRLVEIPIVHPSLTNSSNHIPYLVTSGKIDEEVRIEIDHRNRAWKARGYPELKTIVKGELLNRFIEINTNIWTVELSSSKMLLELFLADGTENADKPKLDRFIQSLLPLNDETVSPVNAGRALASAAVMLSYAINPYTIAGNHVAIIESWMILVANLITLVEKHELAQKYWLNTLNLAETALELTFKELIEELKRTKFLVSGNTMLDFPFYRGRVTWLLGLVSCFGLWRSYKSIEIQDFDKWQKEFIYEQIKYIELWGEGAIPQFLSLVWMLRLNASPLEHLGLLSQVLHSVVLINSNTKLRGLPNPYISFEDYVEEINHIENTKSPEPYVGRSYSAKALIHLFVRRNWRTQMQKLWSPITRLDLAEFHVDESWQYPMWYCEDVGELRIEKTNLTQSWSELREAAQNNDVSLIPHIFQNRPYLLMLFLIVYPHRLTTEVAKFLDSSFYN